VLEQLTELQRELAHLRRVAAATRQMTATLRREPPVELERRLTELRDVDDHALQVLEAVDTLREVAGTLHQTYAAVLAERTNEVVRVLTLFTAAFMPITFVAAVYGMNFVVMPELGPGAGGTRPSGGSWRRSGSHRRLVPAPALALRRHRISGPPCARRRTRMKAPTIAHDTLRHLLATLSYRFEHAVEAAPRASTPSTPAAGCGAPLELVRHLERPDALRRRPVDGRSGPGGADRGRGTTRSQPSATSCARSTPPCADRRRRPEPRPPSGSCRGRCSTP
jgi:hypothetical protein